MEKKLNEKCTSLKNKKCSGICRSYTPPNLTKEEYEAIQSEKDDKFWSPFNVYIGRYGNQRVYTGDDGGLVYGTHRVFVMKTDDFF